MSKFKNIKKYKKVYLFRNDVLNFIDWTNQNGEFKSGVILAVGQDSEGNLLTLTYSEQLVVPLKLNPEQDKSKVLVNLDEDDDTFNVIKVTLPYVDLIETQYRLSVLDKEQKQFKEVVITASELFQMLDSKTELVKEYLTKKKGEWN